MSSSETAVAPLRQIGSNDSSARPSFRVLNRPLLGKPGLPSLKYEQPTGRNLSFASSTSCTCSPREPIAASHSAAEVISKFAGQPSPPTSLSWPPFHSED